MKLLRLCPTGEMSPAHLIRGKPLHPLTFHRDVDALADGQLGLDQHAAQILSFIHPFLDVHQLKSPIFKDHLAVVIGQQQRVLVPLDGVIRVPDHPAVDESVPTRYCRYVLHRSDARGTYIFRRKEEAG